MHIVTFLAPAAGRRSVGRVKAAQGWGRCRWDVGLGWGFVLEVLRRRMEVSWGVNWGVNWGKGGG